MATETISADRPVALDGLPPERRGWAVAAIFTALAMASLDTAIANIALPAIAADLHVGPADVIWVVNVYQIALVATLLPLAALGEIVGHRRIYLGGLLLFTLASLACALCLVVAEPAGRARAARPRRQRHHERQYRAGALRLSEPPAGPRLRAQCARGCDRLHARPHHRLRHSRARAVELAVCHQHPLRPGCDPDRPEDTAAAPRGRSMPSIFRARCWPRPASASSSWESEVRRITRGRKSY